MLDQVPPLLDEYSRSMAVTPTLSEAVQVMLWDEPVAHTSPPLGEVTVMDGGVTSPPASRRVAQMVALMKRMLSRPAASPQPSKMLLLPGCADPSSSGELSPIKK